jgi:integrase
MNPHAAALENERFVAFRSFLESEGLSPVTLTCYASDWWNVSESARRATRRRFRLDRYSADDFLLYRAAETARGVSPATINRRLAFLRRYANFAAKDGDGCRRLAESLSVLPFQAVKPVVANGLSRDAEERIVEAAARIGVVEHALVALLVRTGIRCADALTLLREDVKGSASAPTSVRVHVRSEKTVMLPPRASRAIGALIAAEPGEPLFRARGRYAMSAAGAAAIIAKCAREAGVEATPRTLRHTFAVRYLAENRDDLDGLAQALGPTSAALIRAWRHEAGAESPRPPVAK